MTNDDFHGGTFYVFHAGTKTFMDIDDGVYLIEVPTDSDREVDEEYLSELLDAGGRGHALNRVLNWLRVFGNE